MATVAPAKSREAGLDALRAALTVLVIFHHSAITYGAIGGWYYREVATDARLETKILIFFCTVNQSYFMGLFFLVAGHFTPASVARYGAKKYMADRLLRLGLPLLVYGWVIGPTTIALAEVAHGRLFEETLRRLWARRTFENGPLWFTQTLLLFSVGFLVWRWLASTYRPRRHALTAFPSNGALMAGALGVGAAAFALRLAWPVGWQIWGMQLGYYASYVALFWAGCRGASAQSLAAVPDEQRRFWKSVAWLALPILPAAVLLAPSFPVLNGNTAGGWNIQAVVYAFWEPLVAWGIILSLLYRFGRQFDRLSPVWALLARRAYTIYIIHPPILVAVALLWSGVDAPHLVKFAITGTVASVVCFGLAGLLLRVPAIRKVI